MTPFRMILALQELLKEHPEAMHLPIVAIDCASGTAAEVRSVSVQADGASLEQFGIERVTRYVQLSLE